MTQFTKHLTLNFKAVLRAKIFKFFKKSIWMYVMASVMIAVGYELFGGTYTIGLYVFLILMLVAIMAMLLGSWVLSRKLAFDADVTFSEENITISHRNLHQEIEQRDWSWIKKITMGKTAIWIEINQRPPFIMHLLKSTLTEEEVLFFKQKLK